jgi:hypothetical protein
VSYLDYLESNSRHFYDTTFLSNGIEVENLKRKMRIISMESGNIFELFWVVVEYYLAFTSNLKFRLFSDKNIYT